MTNPVRADDDSFDAASDFEFDDDNWGVDEAVAESSSQKRISRTTKIPISKNRSNRQLNSNGDTEDDTGFQVTYDGGANKSSTQERIRDNLMRKQGSSRSFATLDDLDDRSHVSGSSRKSRSSTASGEKGKRKVRKGKKKSKEPKYGTPECEEYLKGLSPEIQEAERHRLQQKATQEFLKAVAGQFNEDEKVQKKKALKLKKKKETSDETFENILSLSKLESSDDE